MQYEIIKGHPTDRECVIGAYEACELMATYRGYFDWRTHAWTLYPIRRYALPREAAMKKMTLSERDVRYPAPKMGVKQYQVKPAAKDEPKQKAWWAQPDPEGQIKLI